MPVYALNDDAPTIDPTAWIAPDATIIGKVTLERDAGVWFGSVLRGDNERITIGAGTNVQEHAIMHTDIGFPLVIGEGCTIGHRAMLHGCRVGANTLVGMGAIVLNGAVIGEDSLVGAASLVTEGKSFPPRSLIVGSPAKVVRSLSDEEVQRLRWSAAHYSENARRFATGLREA
jgi:carbonic anhydrase/acetyltransferase-like protein (isoleucine patch superfamily)